jgi:hypothetical protein
MSPADHSAQPIGPVPGRPRGELAPEDFEFHERVIRLTKGLVKAYEDWLKAKKAKQA